MVLRRLFGKVSAPSSSAPPVQGPAGRRICAIGDVHGRRDLLDRLLATLAAGETPGTPTTYVFLGDLVDRGPDSRGVIQRAIDLVAQGADCRFLMGNHEEILLKAAAGDRAAQRLFHRIGGYETLQSYGVDADLYAHSSLEDLGRMIVDLIPPEHLAFLEGMEESYRAGDYLFVHAGIRPGTPLDEQRGSDLRWIRELFLGDAQWHGAMIVHGHTIVAQAEQRPNRIAIDTGAYATGCLSALVIEGATARIVDTA